MPKPDAKLQAAGAMSKLFGVTQGEQAATGLRLLAHDQILVEKQPRRSFPAEEIQELADSIAALRQQGGGVESTGVLQPILVTALKSPVDGKRYKLVAGERRYRATLSLKLSHVPAVVVATPQAGLLTAQIVENLQRRDLPPLDEAAAFQQLMAEQNLSIRDAAALIGKPKSYLTDRLALLKMGEDIQSLVSERSDTLLHARVLDKIEDPDLRRELIQAVRDGASLREIQRRANGEEMPVVPPASPAAKSKAGQSRGERIAVERTAAEQLRQSLELTRKLSTQVSKSGKPRSTEVAELRAILAEFRVELDQFDAKLGA